MNPSPTTTPPTRPGAGHPDATSGLPPWLPRVDQTARGQFVIDAWLALDPKSQNASLARLIAATIHDGPDTALGRFAATGALDAEAALAELNDVVVPLEREPWLDALGRHILTQGRRP